jgi:hypothetical protein
MKDGGANRYEKEKGYIFEDVEYDNKDAKGVIISKTICTYVQKD